MSDVVIRSNYDHRGVIESITVMEAPDHAQFSTALLEMADPRWIEYDFVSDTIILHGAEGDVRYQIESFDSWGIVPSEGMWANGVRLAP